MFRRGFAIFHRKKSANEKRGQNGAKTALLISFYCFMINCKHALRVAFVGFGGPDFDVFDRF